jgi:stage II sporulation protein M
VSFDRKVPGPRDFLGYVYGLRWYILAIMAVFAVFSWMGYMVTVLSPSTTDQIISGFKEEVGPLKDASALGLMLGIFENNAIKCFIVVVLGLAFGIAPLLFIMANGLVIGIVVGATLAKAGLFYVLVGIVPHGLIELPMVFVSAAIGLKLGVDALRALARRNVGLKREVREALLIFIFWVAPLLFVAAFLETFVTGALLYMLFSGQPIT